MNWNRNKCMIVGVVCLLLGLQFRQIDSVVLNQPLSERLQQDHVARQTGTVGMMQLFATNVAPMPRQTVEIPRWLGMALLSVGAVLTLQSFVMEQPGGA